MYVHVYEVIHSDVSKFSMPVAPSKKSDYPSLRNHEILLVLREPSMLGFLTLLIGQRYCGGKHSYVVLRKQHFIASLPIFKLLHSSVPSSAVFPKP